MRLKLNFTANAIIAEGRTTQENIDAIKNWNNSVAKYAPILPDELIAVFLLSCSNYLEETKKTIESHYKIKKMYPIVFDNRNVDGNDIKLVQEISTIIPIHWPEKGSTIMYCKLFDSDYKKVFIEHQFKVGIMTTDSIYYENHGNGLIIVIDMDNTGIMHLTRLKIDVLKALLNYVQEGLPLQLKEIRFINSNYVVTKFLAIARMFIKPELYNKIQMHCGYDELHHFIPSKYIPSDYGGELAATEQLRQEAVQKLKKMEAFWLAEEKMRKGGFTYNNC